MVEIAPTGDSRADAVAAVVLWIHDITIRVAAIEAVTRDKLDISDAEWAEADEKAHAATPLPAQPAEGRDTFADLAEFVRRATGPR
jgi:hypothetical protein